MSRTSIRTTFFLLVTLAANTAYAKSMSSSIQPAASLSLSAASREKNIRSNFISPVAGSSNSPFRAAKNSLSGIKAPRIPQTVNHSSLKTNRPIQANASQKVATPPSAIGTGSYTPRSPGSPPKGINSGLPSTSSKSVAVRHTSKIATADVGKIQMKMNPSASSTITKNSFLSSNKKYRQLENSFPKYGARSISATYLLAPTGRSNANGHLQNMKPNANFSRTNNPILPKSDVLKPASSASVR